MEEKSLSYLNYKQFWLIERGRMTGNIKLSNEMKKWFCGEDVIAWLSKLKLVTKLQEIRYYMFYTTLP